MESTISLHCSISSAHFLLSLVSSIDSISIDSISFLSVRTLSVKLLFMLAELAISVLISSSFSLISVIWVFWDSLYLVGDLIPLIMFIATITTMIANTIGV